MAHIGDRLDDFARQTPHVTALTCGALRFSWQELLADIASAERALYRLTPRGGRAALLFDDPAGLLVWFLACARTARIALVLDPEWPATQRETVLAEVRPDLCVDEASANAYMNDPAGKAAKRETPPGAKDLFYAGFTSGSTGTPKGYVRDHGSWLRSFEVSDTEFAPSPARREVRQVVLAGKLSHSLHLYGAVYGLCRGARVALAPRFDPRAIVSELDSLAGGTSLYATPTQLHYISEAVKRSGPAGAVDQVFSSGAKWSDEDRLALKSVFPEARAYEFYGASETSFITVLKADDHVPEGSVGRAAKGVSIAIGDPASPFAPGVPGPVWVKSSLLFSGYICGTSPQTRWQDGWLTFGDNGFLDELGFLYLTGRASRMIVTSGLNVYPEEVEAVLARHPAVAIAVVTGVSDPVRGERLEAVVQLKQPMEDAGPVLLRHCREHLVAGKVPRAIQIRDHLPLTAGGKPDIQRIVSKL